MNPVLQQDLVGALDGLRVYVMHCKDNLDEGANSSMRHIIVPQVKALVEEKRLGAQIIAVEQGMHIGELYHLWPPVEFAKQTI